MTRGLWWVYPVLLAAWWSGFFAVARARDRRLQIALVYSGLLKAAMGGLLFFIAVQAARPHPAPEVPGVPISQARP